ncbi:MAG: hypothetical protein IKP60_06665 [Treponema sp.]|nr:hypothetical protein [Treponema sp.]
MENGQQVMNSETKANNEKKKGESFLKSCFFEMGKGGIGQCILRIVILAAFALIPYFLGRLAFSKIFEYTDAPYKYEVEATLINKEKKVTDYWYAGRKKCQEAGMNYATVKNSKDYEYRDYKKHKFSVDYYLTWEFSIDGEKHNLTTTSWMINFRSIGSKKNIKVFSQDGKEFTDGDSSFSFFWFVLFIVCIVVMLLFAFGILGAFYGIIKFPSKKKDNGALEAGNNFTDNIEVQ